MLPLQQLQRRDKAQTGSSGKQYLVVGEYEVSNRMVEQISEMRLEEGWKPCQKMDNALTFEMKFNEHCKLYYMYSPVSGVKVVIRAKYIYIHYHFYKKEDLRKYLEIILNTLRDRDNCICHVG